MTEEECVAFKQLEKDVLSHLNESDCISAKVDKLMPLVGLIEPLQKIVEQQKEQEAAGKLMVKVGRAVGFIAFVIASVGTIFGAAYFIIKAIITQEG